MMYSLRFLHFSTCLTLFLCLGACGDDDVTPVDGGSNDSGPVDGGPGDSGPSDSGPDAEPGDAGPDATDSGPDAPGPSCTDGVLNGDESDVDCGGGTCPACSAGDDCTAGADCESGICTDDVCVAPECGDGVVRGDEVCDFMDPESPCCLDDCTGTAPAGTACGADPDALGCGAAPTCDGAGTGVDSCVAQTEPDGTACTDDGMFCSGAETCVGGSCTSAGDPCVASAMSCVVDACFNRTVFYRGDFADNGTENVGTYDPVTDMASVLTLMGVDADVDSIAFSADGGLLAVAGQNGGSDPHALNLFSGDFTGAPTVLVDASAASNAGADFPQIVFSPDGGMVAFTVDFDRSGAERLYVVSTAGGPIEALSPLPTSNQDVLTLTWVDDDHIAFVGDVVTDGVNNIYTVNVTTGLPSMMPLVPPASLTSSAEVSSANIEVDEMGRIYFVSDHAVDGTFVLYRANVDGSGLEMVPGTQVMRGDDSIANIGAWSLSPSKAQLAFAADAPSEDLFQVRILDLDSGMPSIIVSDITTDAPASGSRGPTPFAPLHWSPDEQTLAVVADWPVTGTESDNDFAAFLIPTRAPAGGVRVLAPSAFDSNMDVQAALFSADGGYLFVWGDLVDNNDSELYATSDFATADQSPATLLIQDVDTGGDVKGVTVRP